uniref:Ras-specific guanine nucleotide-releasing factor RalGPS1 n=1 Tax=Timema bartmani TaxID=61472 RepID=A0A7R9HW47_9NEOP|nr:unnamed protein product [Timema bartmani]
MANMRYSEMPRDISCDSLTTLKITEEGRCTDKSPGSDLEVPTPAFNGTDSPLLSSGKSPGKGKSPLKPLPPLGEGVKKSTPQKACYDNYGSVPVHSKSHSLPLNASIKSYDLAVFDPLRVLPEDFASQVTLLDVPVFRAICSEELVSCAWNKKNKLDVAPNVVSFTRRFNHILEGREVEELRMSGKNESSQATTSLARKVSFWAVQEILKGSTPKHRSEILAHFIRIAKKLYDLNNLHSLFAIVSALQSASVYRLNKTWSGITKKEKQTFDRLAEVFSDKNNWKHLRNHMESLKLPCIPYLGLFLTDLTYIDMAHPHSGGLESEQRRLKMNNVLRVISDYQQSDYSHLVHLPHIQNYLNSIRYIEELQKFVEDDQYKLSLRLEPPSPAPSSSSSKESVTEAVTITSLSLSPAKVLSSASMRLHNTPGASAATKFVPTHRKCRSLGTKFRSTSLPRNFHKANSNQHYQVCCTQGWAVPGIFSKQPVMACLQPDCEVTKSRHLLDDSVLEEQQQHTRAVPLRLDSTPTPADEEGRTLLTSHGEGRKNNNPLDPEKFYEALKQSIEKKLLSEQDLEIVNLIKVIDMKNWSKNVQITYGENEMKEFFANLSPSSDSEEEVGSRCTIQGCLRRKSVLKEGKKPAVTTWQRYWVQLWATSLVYYSPKSFKGGERSDFKREPYKMVSIVGWSVVLGDNTLQPDVFHLTDHMRGNVYKYRAGSKLSAQQWCRRLEQAAKGLKDKPLPTNLMSFE